MVSKSKDKKGKKDTIEIPVGKYLGKAKKNPWMCVSIILAIVLVVVLIVGGPGGSVSGDKAAQELVDFIDAQGQGTASVVSVEREGALYAVTVHYQGQNVPVFVTLDGEYLITSPVPLDSNGLGSGGHGGSDNTRYDVSTDDDPVLGDPNAPVTIIEFSDYQCGFCGRFWSETLPLIKANYIDTGQVKLVYRDFPLANHPMATPAAIAAECVREQGGDEAYFSYHDVIFENQRSITNDGLKSWAQDMGYNIDTCLDNQEYLEEVQKDMADGQAAGVTGTPAFFVNGLKVEGALPYSSFEGIIEQELANL